MKSWICAARRGVFNFGMARPVFAVSDIVADGVIKQHSVLRHHANRIMQAGLRHVTHVLPVNC